VRGRFKGTDSTHSSSTHKHTQAEDLRPSDSAQHNTAQHTVQHRASKHSTSGAIQGGTNMAAQHSTGEDQLVLQVSKVV
jgi:hypothetical protein